MKLNKKLFYSLPILLGAYLIYRQFASKKDANGDAPPPPPAPTPYQGSTSDYPLRKGSRNDTVRALQTLLNTALQAQGKTLLVTDGIFGTKTENALFELTGNKSVKSSSEFEAVKKQLATTNQLSANMDWAWKLVDAYNSGKFTNLVVRYGTVTLNKVQKNFQGEWINTGKSITLPATNFNLKDYAIRSATNKGGLRIEITNGNLAGMYITADDTIITQFDIV